MRAGPGEPSLGGHGYAEERRRQMRNAAKDERVGFEAARMEVRSHS
jgi:hypothetical protein